MKTKEQQLANQLEIEKIKFEKNGFCVKDHEKAIDYLLTNNKHDEKGDLLQACINDFEFIFNDYCN